MAQNGFLKGYAAGWLTWFLIAVGAATAIVAVEADQRDEDE